MNLIYIYTFSNYSRLIIEPNLTDYHKDHGEYDTASLFCSRLLEYPGPEKEVAKACLRELRSRKSQVQVNRQQGMRTRSKGPPVSPWAMDESTDAPDSGGGGGGESSFEFSP